MAKEIVKQLIDKVTEAEPVQALVGFSPLFIAVANTAANLSSLDEPYVATRNTIAIVEERNIEELTDITTVSILCDLLEEIPTTDYNFTFHIIAPLLTTHLNCLTLKRKGEVWKSTSKMVVAEIMQIMKTYGKVDEN